MKREFTGVFIPAHIWTSNEISAIGKMLLAEIDALSQNTGWCYASRAHFAEWLGTTESNLSLHFKKLADAGFLEIERIPGETNKMRVVSNRFHIKDGVSKTYGGGKENLRGGVSKTYGGGKENLPVNTIEIKEEREGENSHAPVVKQVGLKTETSAPIPPIPQPPPSPAPRWQDVPNSNTPREFETYLTRFYDQFPEQLEAIRERTQFQNNPSDVPAAIADFCAWAVGEGWNRRTLQQINARLGRWFRDEKRFDSATGKPGVLQERPTPIFVNPQTPIRFAK